MLANWEAYIILLSLDMITTKIINNIDEMILFSRQIALNIEPRKTIALYGSLGVGKSFFAKNFINSLQDKPSNVLSPTFNIVYSYATVKGEIYHFDLYRLKHEQELENIGFFAVLKNYITLIEWPEIAAKYLPNDTMKITINNVGNDSESRAITIEV